MTQAQLQRAVARAAGETVDFIRRMGFVHLPRPRYRIRKRRRRRAWRKRFSQRLLLYRGGFPSHPN